MGVQPTSGEANAGMLIVGRQINSRRAGLDECGRDTNELVA